MLLNRIKFKGFISCRPFSAALFVALCVLACSSNDDYSNLGGSSETPEPIIDTLSVSILSLGDSYTVGTGVCDTCNYPTQLTDSLAVVENPIYETEIRIIARSGWTASDLLDEVNNTSLENNYNLVTLLIGVNNQFQGRPFAEYESDFTALLDKSIELAGNNESNVVVLSIPDYAFSPFGQNWGNPVTTSAQIDNYNAYAAGLCQLRGVSFLEITDISREGLSRTEIIASDGLHLSEIAYSEITERLLPLVRAKLESD